MSVLTYLSFLVKLTCGNKISSPNCNLCPKNGDIMTNSWCAGNCYYDENNEMCKEGILKYLIDVESQIILKSLQCSFFA